MAYILPVSGTYLQYENQDFTEVHIHLESRYTLKESRYTSNADTQNINKSVVTYEILTINRSNIVALIEMVIKENELTRERER